MKPLSRETIREMQKTAYRLIPNSFPLVSREEEIKNASQKQIDVIVDGYRIGLYYNECVYGKCLLNSVQVFSKSFSYLPFDLVLKIGILFLGSHKLSLIEVPYEGKSIAKKIYVWTVYYIDGNIVDNPFHATRLSDEYDGIKFNRIDSSNVKFF